MDNQLLDSANLGGVRTFMSQRVGKRRSSLISIANDVVKAMIDYPAALVSLTGDKARRFGAILTSGCVPLGSLARKP